ncbi:hypothetical protein [Kingella negevensis]|uniref:hypothetical protein n=1 Tax=Kingella negevensis TaxID=1522312 RepID=UPI000A9C62E2|nr:hypothetical protein [Kingella negevensis]MDK4680600.1 hypothetical protein [Kingella negevensis]MDK4681677.1 hypothetical protein [Kingella negevensis]MDK4685550.1 hypothetical protein [Kingella negevensis]MDK4687691.1 hypothetical protein [Kingella negevensis]MDK4689875.1 hypothetical protein [Kingella negevensis]
MDPNDFVAQLGGELSPANAASLLDMMNGAEITELLDDMNAPDCGWQYLGNFCRAI